MKEAIVIHSGGMDSSICLALAIRAHKNVLSLSFSYDQRHSTELEAAAKICRHWGVDHEVIQVDVLRQVTANALMDRGQEIRSTADTMVLGRNGLMARLGAIYAHHQGAKRIYMGVMKSDAYRDCSREYMDLMERVMQLDLDDPEFRIVTPLVEMSKEETMAVADELGVLDYLLENTVTCYEGTGCGKCPACVLRRQGLEAYRASLSST